MRNLERAARFNASRMAAPGMKTEEVVALSTEGSRMGVGKGAIIAEDTNHDGLVDSIVDEEGDDKKMKPCAELCMESMCSCIIGCAMCEGICEGICGPESPSLWKEAAFNLGGNPQE